MGGGILMVSVLCGGRFCVDSGKLFVGTGVWIVVDFGGFSNIKFS